MNTHTEHDHEEFEEHPIDVNPMDKLISLFPSAMAKEPDRAFSLEDFFKGVRDGRWKKQIDFLRDYIKKNNRALYDKKKRELPAVTISCHCLSRERELSPEGRSITHSGWLQCDFDLKDNPIFADPGAVMAVREKLMADDHVGGVFVGPSGEGLKAVMAIDFDRHSESWFAAEAYFKEHYNLKLDRATKDPLRLCFVSYDPIADYKEDARVLPVPDSFTARPTSAGSPSSEVFSETTAEDVAEMLSFIPPRPDYDTWLRIASAVWSVLPMAEGARLLHEWSPEEKDGEYALKHKARLTQINIGTLAHIASEHGFDARAAWKRKRWAGRIRFADGERAPTTFEDVPVTNDSIIDLSRERVAKAIADQQAGDARLWCDVRRGQRTWNIHAKMWMIYSDGIWMRDPGHETPWDISDLLCNIYDELANTIRQELKENPPEDAKKDSRCKELVTIQSRIDSLHKWQYLSGVEKFAQRDLCSPATAFDTKIDLLVLENGTLDFSEGVFREHRSDDMATYRAPIRFDPDADCPEWLRFLELIMPDPDTRDYLSRAIGYSLTARVQFDVMFFCYGGGANGKSTFLGALKLLLGEMMTTVPIAALLAAKSDNNFDYHKASMEGKRVVLTDEIPDNRRLAAHQVKAVTGGDPINARRPFEQPYTFMPTHKLWLMGNHKPVIEDTDEGIWRRVHLIPFLVTIPENERRPRHEVLADFQTEASGILNWAIRGLLESRDIGLMPPAEVVNATREYRESSDQFGTFLAECVEQNTSVATKVASIGKVYKSWCEKNDEYPRYKGTKAIRKTLEERGFVIEIDRKNSPVALGVALIEEADNQGPLL